MTTRVSGVLEALDSLKEAVDRNATKMMDEVATMLAVDAAADHPYENQTGDLEAGTRAGETTGRALAGTLRGSVEGDTEYGEYLEDEKYALSKRFAYLKPAWDRREGTVAGLIELHMQQACDDAGLGR